MSMEEPPARLSSVADSLLLLPCMERHWGISGTSGFPCSGDPSSGRPVFRAKRGCGGRTECQGRLLSISKGFDGNKKVKGIKRQIAVDKNGHLLDVKTNTANVYDSKGELMLLALLAASHPAIKKILADRGYRGELIELVRNVFGMNVEITLSGSSDGKFIPAKGRWVAERSISWLDNFRRLCRNYEVSLEVARQMVIIAGVAMLLNRLPQN